MICPDTDFDCDNPGCRHGGCQGRRPELPLLRGQSQARTPQPGAEADVAAALSLSNAQASRPTTTA